MYFYDQLLFKLYILTSNGSFAENLQKIQEMPTFFQDSINWGLEASYKALGFMAVLVLGLSMFKR